MPILTELSGYQLLNDPQLNKGTAFSEEERDAFDLHGLLPPTIASLDEQVARRLKALRGQPSDLDKYVFLRGLQDTNETLFYALMSRHIEELLPIVYTPTVGLGCRLFSHIFRKPRGLFLSVPHQQRIRRILSHPRYDQVTAIVVTDGQRILGLGDQGAGGMGIPIGKLAIYTACGGFHPSTTLPIMLDVGTDNEALLADPQYVGWRHRRVDGAQYDAFIDEFVSAVDARWPHVLLQWEDFAKANAGRLLTRYRDRLCTFNDDIQGTAAVATGTILAAMSVTGEAAEEQRVAIMGAGSAGCGIAHLLSAALAQEGADEAEVRRHFYLVDREGLLVEGMNDLAPFQRPFAQARENVARWKLADPGRITLEDVAANARPTVLIGVSGQAGAFSKATVQAMARSHKRPVILPLSNPTSNAEAKPEDLMEWTEGRAIIGTGSPFPPIRRNGRERSVDQTNNSYIFPGVALGAVTVKARRISDAMFMAAARSLADQSPARRDPDDNLLPPVTKLREAAHRIAIAVAEEAIKEGLAAEIPAQDLDAATRAAMWTPVYRPYRRVE